MVKYYIPKTDAHDKEYLKKYPEYDGRGLLIAIIDDAIDVSLPGMQETTAGLPKIIDCFDSTGEGNVDTSTIRIINHLKNHLIGLSGRKYIIPSNWKNPSQRWHLGLKPLEELFTKSVYEDMVKPLQKQDKIIKAVADCIVWNDGKKWKAAVVTPFCDSNLKNVKVLTNFRDEHDFSFILKKYAYCITIYNEGNLLEIFTPSSFHGTAVAHITAGYFADKPDWNGLAPGAQILPIKIVRSDKIHNLLQATNSYKKALKKCIEMKVDIINLSINLTHEKDINKIFKDMVEKHGMIILKSAGNEGPGYFSIRKDVEVHYDELFVIGSIINNEMKSKFYESEERIASESPALCLHSAKGPLYTGARGITFTALGMAITPAPRWHNPDYKYCYGTSYAAPNAAGSIACLLSSLKLNFIKYTPATIKMALLNTAYLPEGAEKIGFGNGIIQRDSAFYYLKKFSKFIPGQPLLKATLLSEKTNNEGILLIDTKNQTYKNRQYTVKVEPTGCRPSEYEIPWLVKSTPEAQTFITCSKNVSNNTFNLEIDVTMLKTGSINYAEICGYHPLHSSLGPVFYFPVTVIVPKEASLNVKKEVVFSAGAPFNLFLIPPYDNEECIIKLCDEKNEKIEHCGRISKARFKSTDIYMEFPELLNSKKPWSIFIRWEKVLHICISPNIFSDDSENMTYNIEIIFNAD